MSAFTLDELAKQTLTDREFLEDLIEAGVIEPGVDDLHAAGDIFRVRAVESFLASGFTLEQLAAALSNGLFTFEYLDRFYAVPSPISETTIEELASTAGRDTETLSAVYAALGLAEPDALHEDEVEILREFLDLWGIDDDALVRAARLIGEPVRALTEGWTRLYVEKISLPLDAWEVPLEERTQTIVESTEKATRLAPKMLQWLFQRHLRGSIDKANIEGLEDVMARHGLVAERSPATPTIAFVDASGFTAMTEVEGDQAALGVASRLRGAAEEVLRRSGGTLVKHLGDGVMLHFDSPSDSVAAVLELVNRMREMNMLGHAGIHTGPVIEHDGDYYGNTVNLASRVADVAGPGEVAITEAVLLGIEGEEYRATPLGAVGLKGTRKPLPIFLLSAAS